MNASKSQKLVVLYVSAFVVAIIGGVVVEALNASFLGTFFSSVAFITTMLFLFIYLRHR